MWKRLMDVKTWLSLLPVVAGLLAVGIWVGSLDARVVHLEGPDSAMAIKLAQYDSLHEGQRELGDRVGEVEKGQSRLEEQMKFLRKNQDGLKEDVKELKDGTEKTNDKLDIIIEKCCEKPDK